MEANAKAYSILNKPQYDQAYDFVRSLKISEGDRVLDMGCGSGDVTSNIASLVGIQGEVVGVDKARIKIAQEKYKDVRNLQFIVGDSSGQLPKGEQEYYDLHFSSNVVHWCVGEQITVYLNKARECLKPGGRLAFLSALTAENVPVDDKEAFHIKYRTKEKYKQLCEEALFQNVFTEVSPTVMRFPDLGAFKAWFRATTRRELTSFNSDWVKSVMDKCIATDGSVVRKVEIFRLIGQKKSNN